MNLNDTLNKVIKSTCDVLNSKGKIELAKMFAKCFPNTWETTIKKVDIDDTFVITGDIPAMWLRDSAAQVNHYIPYAKNDKEIFDVIVGIINRYALCLSKDPYANAFNEIDNDQGYFSRKWFAWTNSLFSELVLKYIISNILLIIWH